MKKLATFGYVVDSRPPHANLSLFSENLNWSANERKALSLSDQSLEGRCWRWPWRVRIGSAEGLILGGVWCLAYIEVSSAKTEAYDC